MKCKTVPKNASQHVTAGPYSPVLQVKASTIVVISGQAALDKQGNILGDTIEEQTEHTLANCLNQLNTAGCGFDDVFKVNVYLKDIKEWDRFNEVYKKIMPAPAPVRTCVQAVLIEGFLVEIEMWAGKNA